MEKGQFTRDEIITQTDAWIGALRVVEAAKKDLINDDLTKYQQIIFTGCGSTYYLSLAAASLFQEQTQIFCRAIPGGELLMNPGGFYSGNHNLLVAISRSGSTSETVEAVRQFKKNNGGKVITISNYSNQPLSELSDLELCIPEGQEQSIAQTRAFTSMLVASSAIAMIASNRMDLLDGMKRLPSIGKTLIDRYYEYAKQVGENLAIDRFYFLGSGLRYGIACEASLKMKEMTITHSEPFHFLEFRHGPISMVNEQTMVCGMVSDRNRDFELNVIKDVRKFGASVITLAEENADVCFESGLPESIRTVLYLPILQIIAFHRSLVKGFDPDKPKNLSAVVYI